MPLSFLNEEQLKAATAPFGNNLIIASAGTGKTSTIVGRISYLLTKGIDPSKILLLTFTNKAALEMINRLMKFFDKDMVKKIEAGTFHAVSYRWLKERYPNLTLKQPSELKTLFRSIYEKRDFKKLALQKEMEAFSASYLYELYSLYQNSANSLIEFDEWFLKRYPNHSIYIDIYMDILDEFERLKKEYGFLSFNDLLIEAIKLLKVEPKEFQEVLVDEYQDTNTLQEEFIKALKKRSLFCVGDYDQSIYAFNGANIENISTFNKRYPGSNIFSLTINYRSTSQILSLANRVIEFNERIYPKELRVGKKIKGEAPKLLIFNELYEQYEEIAKRIKNSITPYNEIAVIFRNNSSADGIEARLRELNIPAKRKGGVSFFDTKEVKLILDILMFISNPKDLMAFIHILEYGKKIGGALANDLYTIFSHLGEGNVIDGIISPKRDDLPKLNRTKNDQLGLFGGEIESFRRDFKELNLEIKYHPVAKLSSISKDSLEYLELFKKLIQNLIYIQKPQELIEKILDSSLFQYCAKILATQRSKLKSGEIDREKFNESYEKIFRKGALLKNLAMPYDNLNRFINAMVLGSSEIAQGDGVNLLSVHASKGLEFEEVYVIDLMDGRFPNRKLMNKSGSIEEERRLFYVAVTRAKSKLFLSFAKYDRFKDIKFKPSQFLIEANLIKEGQF